MKRSLLILSVIIITHNCFAQAVADSSLLLSEKDMQWWKDCRFGLFIHFGLYSVLGQGEWAMFYKRMDTSEYGKLKDSFTVSKFAGKKWVDVAKQAGCRYMVVTSRTGSNIERKRKEALGIVHQPQSNGLGVDA